MVTALGNMAKPETAINKTIDIVQANLELQLSGFPINIPVWSGKPGMGKTAHVKMLANSMGLQLVYISMNKPYEFFSGLPNNYDKKSDDNSIRSEGSYTIWSEPDMIHVANDKARKIAKTKSFVDDNGVKHNNAKGVMIFLDDLHCANDSVQKYFYEIVLEKSLNGYKLDKNVCIMCAMNGSMEAGYDGFFSAIISRLQIIDVRMDFDVWYQNIGITLHPYVSTFLLSNPSYREEDETREAPFASYRSWTNLGILLKKMDEMANDPSFTNFKTDTNNIPEKMKLIAMGFVSGAAAAALKDSIIQYITFNFDAMIKNNAYSIDDDTIKQFMFGCIVNNLDTIEHCKEFIKFIDSILSTRKKENYQNLINSILTNAGALNKHLKAFKNDSEEYEIKIDIIKMIVKYMYSNPFTMKVAQDLTL